MCFEPCMLEWCQQMFVQAILASSLLHPLRALASSSGPLLKAFSSVQKKAVLISRWPGRTLEPQMEVDLMPYALSLWAT